MKTWATTSKIARITQAGHNGELDIELQDLARHLAVTTSQQGLVIINQKTRNKSKTNNAIVVRQKLIQKSAITRSGQGGWLSRCERADVLLSSYHILWIT